MSVTASGLFVANMLDVFDATGLRLDLSLTTHKLALFSDSITPNFSTDVGYGAGPYASNEVISSINGGVAWPAGGLALSALAAGGTSAVPTLTESPAGTMKYDHTNDVNVASTSLAAAMCALLYANALTGKNGIVLVDFVTAANTTNGTFGITWPAGGIFTVDWTP
jgi:hypothetical protein